jgi:hypothetical protein
MVHWIGQYHAIGHDAVSFSVNTGCNLSARSINQAPRLLLLQVEPIGEVLHSVLVLDLQIPHMSGGQINCADTAQVFMAIKVDGHLTPFQTNK